ncbi:MAG TPA: NADH-quinone oxidoreductase subunit I [Anaeromyxobacteraceae bacterium]|nr:NADH-quinone oxidoreductase subunit I [Anaeromyxobacteraceae bacterium]
MPYSLPQDKPVTFRERIYVPEVLRGLAVVTRHFLKNVFFSRDANPDVLARDRRLNLVTTVQYPEERVTYPPGYRGLHRLVPREDGRPRCVACYMCATACPAQCIYIEAGEVEGDPIEKYPTRFVIDELRCVVCGFCVEACPKDAIRMDTGEHAPATYTRAEQVWDEKRLLRGAAVSYPSDPWLRREAPGVPAADLQKMKAAARPYPPADDEYARTPGFSPKALAAEVKGRGGVG